MDLHNHVNLAAAISDAASMAELTVEFIGRAVGVDEGEEVTIDSRDVELVSYALNTMLGKIKKIRDAFDECVVSRDGAPQ